MASFSEELRQAAGDQWNRVIHHRWTKELANGTLDLRVMRRYLIQDHRFLDAFVVLLSSMIAHAQTLEDRIPGCQFLALITGKENTYFERCFEKLPRCTVTDRAKVPDAACTKGFDQLMRDAAMSGNVGEMLSVLIVCEWSYLSWAKIVDGEAKRENFVLFEWIDLHTSLEDVVAYLRKLLDNEGERLDAAGRERCQKRFLQAVQLEEDFFENAFALEDEDV
ncbi:tenA [Symbiodinium natans]|uniref:TenA protein n=1 Tax=Symbiodinium natans TaxID=878477 RepID=A0A812Q6U1_9DINO|nr:tenA [Symbiodinium natans]